MNVRIVDIFSFLNETYPVKFSAQISDTTAAVKLWWFFTVTAKIMLSPVES